MVSTNMVNSQYNVVLNQLLKNTQLQLVFTHSVQMYQLFHTSIQ